MEKWKISDCDFNSKLFEPSRFEEYFIITEKSRKDFDFEEGYRDIFSVLFNGEFVIVVTDFYNMKTARLLKYEGNILKIVVRETDPRQAQE